MRLQMETRKKPQCVFGAKCFRKNPKHLERFSHPHKISDYFKGNPTTSKKKVAQEANTRNSACGSKKMKEETTTETTTLTGKNSSSPSDKVRSSNRKEEFSEGDTSPVKSKRKKISDEIHSEEVEKLHYHNNDSSKGLVENNGKTTSSESVQTAPGITIEDKTNEDKSLNLADFKNKTPEEIIKSLFLVDMPPDFYSFYEFCKSVSESCNSEPLKFGELELVGPFDVLSGKLDYSLDPNIYVYHWRFYYDPPEFQTLLAAESGFHFGYWRDEPKENPVFVASNNSNKDCIFKIEAENLFGAVFHYLNEFKKTSDPFKKVEATKLQQALKDWAEKNEFTLEKKTSKMRTRQKKVVSKTFHGAGIVVPVEAETELGYRPLIETDAKLKNICESIIKAKDENERESLWEDLQPLITAANIANDECDFGNSLELGIDLFCMGSSVFHETIEYLLTTAYSLLNRPEFETIIREHLKSRRKDNNCAIKVS